MWQLLMVKHRTEAGATYPGRTAVWRRVVSMPFLPAAGDVIALWPDGDDALEREWPVRLRRFAFDGSAAIELATMSVDPPAPIHPAFQRDFTELPWYTKQEDVDDLDAALVRGRWERR